MPSAMCDFTVLIIGTAPWTEDECKRFEAGKRGIDWEELCHNAVLG